MKKVNRKDIGEERWESPKGTFAGAFKGLSIALGRKAESTDLLERHPFDVEISRIPAGKRGIPYHSHSAQWLVRSPEHRLLRSEALEYLDGEE